MSALQGIFKQLFCFVLEEGVLCTNVHILAKTLK